MKGQPSNRLLEPLARLHNCRIKTTNERASTPMHSVSCAQPQRKSEAETANRKQRSQDQAKLKHGDSEQAHAAERKGEGVGAIPAFRDTMHTFLLSVRCG